MFSLSSGESLENLPQSLSLEGEVSQEFTDTLLEKVQRLNIFMESDNATVTGMAENSEVANKQHGIAGLFNESGTAAEFTHLFGKGLPQGIKLEKGIDLENTLEALASVMNTLEGGTVNNVDLEQKLNSLMNKVEALKQAIPAESNLLNKFTETEDVLETIRQLFTAGGVSEVVNNDAFQIPELIDESSAFVELDVEKNSNDFLSEEIVHQSVAPKQGEENSHVGVIVQSIKAADDAELTKNSGVDDYGTSDALGEGEERRAAGVAVQRVNVANVEEPTIGSVADNYGAPVLEHGKEKHDTNVIVADARLDNIGFTEILDDSNSDFLKEKLQHVVDVVEKIKIIYSEESIDLGEQINTLVSEVVEFKGFVFDKLSDKSADIDKVLNLEIDAGKESSELQIENQIAALVASISAPGEQEKNPVSSLVAQDMKNEVKRESLSPRQIAENRGVDFSVKADEKPESLLQQENALRKPGMDNPIVAAKQAETIELVSKEPEQSIDKPLPKFATDIANLNRAVTSGSKIDVPPMTKHFAHPEWNKEMGERVVWMTKQAIPSAELRLNPGHLGPIVIKIDANQDQVNVTFTTQHAAVKEAIEAALPRLRELFSAQQLNLANVDVSQQDAGQRQPRGFSQMGGDAGKGDRQEANELVENDEMEGNTDISEEIEAGRAIARNGFLSIFA